MDALIEREADLDVDAPLGTAANLAASKGLVDILLALLDAGADAGQIDDLREGQFLLMRATTMDLAAAVRALVGAGVDSSAAGVTPVWEMGNAVADRLDQPLEIEHGVFPLLAAARLGLPDTVAALVAAGAAANQATTLLDRCGDEQKGVTALLVACEVPETPETRNPNS